MLLGKKDVLGSFKKVNSQCYVYVLKQYSKNIDALASRLAN